MAIAEKALLVREFSLKDFERVMEIAESSFARELALFGFDREAARKQLKFYRIAKLIQHTGRRPFLKFYVGELMEDGVVVATTTLNRRGSSWYIGAVMVGPDYRRMGLWSGDRLPDV